MKFVHIADMHMDSPFTVLTNKSGLGETRRLEQRKVLGKVIEYIKENKIEYLFIAGDLYEQEYVRKTTIDYINAQFKSIPDTKIFISPGNHDPFIKNSYYSNYEWSKNVYIFKGKFERISEENVDIYGMGFTDFHLEDSNISELCIQDENKINILVMHADLNGTKDMKGYSYNPVTVNQLKNLNMDYVALGHIHNTNYSQLNERIIYPGSTVSLGFDELGNHGMVVGEILKNSIKLEFLKLDDRVFVEKEVEITNLNSNEEIIEKIDMLDFEENYMYKIILTGKRKFEVDEQFIIKNVNNNNILKIENRSKLNYDLEKLSKEISLKGFFVKECLSKLNNGEYTEEEIERAIEIGLDSM